MYRNYCVHRIIFVVFAFIILQFYVQLRHLISLKKFDGVNLKFKDDHLSHESCHLCNADYVMNISISDIHLGKKKFDYEKIKDDLTGDLSNLSLKDYIASIGKPYEISHNIKSLHKRWSNNLRMNDMGNISLSYLQKTPQVNWSWHPRERKDRFPGIQERIEYYMGLWYNTSIPMSGKEFERATTSFGRCMNSVDHQNPMMIDPLGLDPLSCLRCNVEEKSPTKAYCKDIVDLALLHSHGSASVVIHFGDSAPDAPHELRSFPFIGKVRRIGRSNNIIWPLNRKRHYVSTLSIPFYDVKWENKRINGIVWRGGPKGEGVIFENNTFAHESKSLSVNQKWSIISKYVNSSIVDAKFVVPKRKSSQFSNIPKSFRGAYYDYETQLKYKYLLSLEGNDVASGLKWMLFSNSLVFSPPMTYASWAMESLLKPFVHFIPLKADLSDLEEKVNWANMHPTKSKMIAERATLFVYDLLFHPDSLSDEEKILQGIMEIYERNFGSNHQLLHSLPDDINLTHHAEYRYNRFPSVSERVSYYLGTWNVDIGPNNTKSLCPSNNEVTEGEINFHLKCPNLSGKVDSRNKRSCDEYFAILKGLSTNLNKEANMIHVMDHFGNIGNIPVFSGYRHLGNEMIRDILWPLQDTRYDWVLSGKVEQLDTPYHEKEFSAVAIVSDQGIHELPSLLKAISSTRIFYHNVSEKSLFDDAEFANILKSKYFIAVEGMHEPNLDLMWMFLSQSVVLMPWPLTYTSWFMEDKLHPFVHFIPLRRNLTDLDDVISWCQDPANSDTILKVRDASTLYVHDFFFHPGAERDNQKIKTFLIEKYLSILSLQDKAGE